MVSWIFSSRNIGIFIGALFATKKGLNPFGSLVGISVLCFINLVFIPEITNFGVLNVSIFSLGFANGFVDSIGIIILISNFVPDVAARLVGAFHLLYNLGAVSGSAIMDRYIDVELEIPCPTEELVQNSKMFFPIDEDFSLTYKIPALMLIPISLLLYYIYYQKLYEKLRNEKLSWATPAELENENEKPKKLKYFIGIYLFVLFSIASTQQIGIAYVHQYSRCSKTVNATSLESANNMIYFWIFNTLGRFSV